MTTPLSPSGNCPICNATDAFVEPLRTGDEYYVECLNCKVYRASRKVFRHFEYLRNRGTPEGLAKLARLGAALGSRSAAGAARLDYDNWEELLSSTGS